MEGSYSVARSALRKHACADLCLQSIKILRALALVLGSGIWKVFQILFCFGEGSLGPSHVLLLPLSLLLQTLYLIPAFLGFVGLRTESPMSVARLACGISGTGPPASYCCLAA